LFVIEVVEQFVLLFLVLTLTKQVAEPEQAGAESLAEVWIPLVSVCEPE
jgi:glycerol uptake facilitator-like aquaporin